LAPGTVGKGKKNLPKETAVVNKKGRGTYKKPDSRKLHDPHMFSLFDLREGKEKKKSQSKGRLPGEHLNPGFKTRSRDPTGGCNLPPHGTIMSVPYKVLGNFFENARVAGNKNREAERMD